MNTPHPKVDFGLIETGIIQDLSLKVTEDVGATISLTIALCPAVRMTPTIALAGAKAAVAMLAGVLAAFKHPHASEPPPIDKDLMLLAGLMCWHSIQGTPTDEVQAAATLDCRRLIGRDPMRETKQEI